MYGTQWCRSRLSVNFKYGLTVEFFMAFRNTLNIIIAVLLISPCIRMYIKCSRSPAFYMKNTKFNSFVKIYRTYFSFQCAKLRTVKANKTNSFHTSPCRFNTRERAPDTHRIGDLGPGCSTTYSSFCSAATIKFQPGACIRPF